jgi:2-hydroxychromene-2-carboxylate isomerase
VAGRSDCCRYEATLDELIDDEVMAPVLRSAGLDPQRFRDLLAETARRYNRHAGDERANNAPGSWHGRRAQV